MRFLLAVMVLFIVSCGRYSNEMAQRDLNIVLKEDLKAIISGLKTDVLLPSPYDTIIELKWYEKSRYSCNAVVDFYFLKDSSYCIERKYRLNKAKKKWERYQNEYKLIEK